MFRNILQTSRSISFSYKVVGSYPFYFLVVRTFPIIYFQARHIMSERNVLLKNIKHPFLVVSDVFLMQHLHNALFKILCPHTPGLPQGQRENMYDEKVIKVISQDDAKQKKCDKETRAIEKSDFFPLMRYSYWCMQYFLFTSLPTIHQV